MDDAGRYADRPFAFILRYVRLRPVSHAVIVIAVLAAVACSVTTQYGVKHLVDTLSLGPSAANGVWLAFAFLVLLIAADNLLWRVAGWIATLIFCAASAIRLARFNVQSVRDEGDQSGLSFGGAHLSFWRAAMSVVIRY